MHLIGTQYTNICFFFTGWQDVIRKINEKLIKDCTYKTFKL